jgi:endonuclease/exonuclease/phosphatase family metal-dependent hydrolase
MYRGDRFTFIEQGFFFFSETPDEIYSSSWDGRFPAYCSWARFRDRSSGTTFSVYNVHFDAASRRNRLLSADLVAARVSNREHPEEPVLVVGDFNAPWFFPAVARVADAGLRIANTTGSTYHFYRGIRILPAIDHVLHSPTLEHDSTEVLRRRYDGVWPSDHFPVVVSLVIPSSGGRTRRRSSVVGRPLHERGIAVRFADDGK